MHISRLSGKGQVTIPKEIRENLGATPGDKVVFTLLEQGKALVSLRNRPASSLFGFLKDRPRSRTGPASVAEMEAVIRARRLATGLAGIEDRE